jgi:hypothetical protein
VQKLGFTALENLDEDAFCEEVPLTVASLWCLQEHPDELEPPGQIVPIREVTQDPPHPLDTPAIQAKGDRIFERYGDTVLRPELMPNPKVRGGEEIGYA